MTTKKTPSWWKSATASVPEYRRKQASAAEEARTASALKQRNAQARYDQSRQFAEKLRDDERSSNMAWRQRIDQRNSEVAAYRNEAFKNDPGWERLTKEKAEVARLVIPDEVEIHGRKYKPDLRGGIPTGWKEVLTEEEKLLKREAKLASRKVSALGKAIATAELAKKFDILSMLDYLPAAYSSDNPPDGWKLVAKCTEQSLPVNAWAGANFAPGTEYLLQSVMCLGGQVGGGTLADALKTTTYNIIGGFGVPDNSGSINRMTTMVAWSRGGPSYMHNPERSEEVAFVNPNALRARPADRTRSVPIPKVSSADSPQSAIVIDVGAASNGTPPPGPTYRATPTARGTSKERKGSAGAEIMAILDKVSEASEVVDCFYKALPEDVRNKWDAIGKAMRNRGPYLDQAGQYGIDGADWKARALWHNWHKVDLNDAIHCVAVNHLEDEAYGFANKHKDRVSRARNFKRTLRGK